MIIFIKQRYHYYRRFELDIWGLCYLDIATSIDPEPHTFGLGYKYNKYIKFQKKELYWKKLSMKFLKKNLNRSDRCLYLGEPYMYLISVVAKSWLLRFFYRLYDKAEIRKYEKLRRYIYRIDIIKHTKKRKKVNKRFISLRITRLYFLTVKDHQFRILFKKASKLDGNLESNYCLLLECRAMAIVYRTNFLYNIFEILQFIKEGHILINCKKITYVNSNVKLFSHITCTEYTKKRLRRFLKQRLKNGIALFNTPKFLFISYYFLFAYLCKMPIRKDFVYPFSLDIQRITGYN